MGIGLSGGPIIDVREIGEKAAKLALEVLDEQKHPWPFSWLKHPNACNLTTDVCVI